MKKKIGLPKVRNPLPAPMMKRPIKEGRGEKPTTSKPDIDEGKWGKEFEDKIYVTMEDGLQIKKNWYNLFKALKGNHLFKEKIPVKIKYKDGCIQIERIGQ